MQNCRQKGFTLAEVLIALAVIGVIAAITIPNLMAAYRKQVIITKLKKVYSIFSDATNRSLMENGGIITSNYCTYVYNLCLEDVHDLVMVPHVKFLKYCPANTSGDNCPFRNSPSLYGGMHPFTSSTAGYLLDDGTWIGIWNWDNVGTMIVIDVNGSLAPNKYGQDAFVLRLTKNGLIPESHNGCINNGASYAGHGCFAKIVKDGWEFVDDYPFKI